MSTYPVGIAGPPEARKYQGGADGQRARVRAKNISTWYFTWLGIFLKAKILGVLSSEINPNNLKQKAGTSFVLPKYQVVLIIPLVFLSPILS